MKIQQVNNVKFLNQQSTSENNNNYYKTSPMEYDSVSFQAKARASFFKRILAMLGFGTTAIVTTGNVISDKPNEVNVKSEPALDIQTPPDYSKLNFSKYKYPIVSKDSEYATKIDFEIPENATITYPDGAVKPLKKVINEDGVNNQLPSYDIFIKDKDGNIFKYDSHYKEYTYFDLSKNRNNDYYALSEDNELYSINLEKLPEGQAFAFSQAPIRKRIIIPKGTKVEFGEKTYIAGENSNSMYSVLSVYIEDGNTKCYMRERVERYNVGVVDSVSEQRWNTLYGKLQTEEANLIKELDKQNSVEEKRRNMEVCQSTEKWGRDDDMRTVDVTPDENNFYKQVYDYYVDKYENYKDFKFIFKRLNSQYTLKIMDGDNVIDTMGGREETIDGPIFDNSRVKRFIGDVEAIYPNRK